ncbi:MAG: hypothetical protein P8045_17575 [Candidatus Thiodiazotropha sp.]
MVVLHEYRLRVIGADESQQFAVRVVEVLADGVAGFVELFDQSALRVVEKIEGVAIGGFADSLAVGVVAVLRDGLVVLFDTL